MKVTEYTFEDTEKLADEVFPTVTAKVVCSTCGKELSVPATVVGATDEGGNAVYDVKPTCTADGERTFTASVEGYESAEGVVNSKKYTIKALGHKLSESYDFKWVEDKEGNPVVEATGTCTVCNEKITETLVPEQEFVEGQEPTCTTSGKVRYFVNSNGINTSKEVAVEALGHDIVFHDETPSTCVEKGWNEATVSGGAKLDKGQVRKYGQCSVCKKYFRAVLDEATGEIALDKNGAERKKEVDENTARKAIDTVTGHDYKVKINWVELKDAQGNVIGYDRNATKTATLECTREGCLNANSVGGNWGHYSLTVDLKPCFGGNLDLELEGKCTDADGAIAKYTATVDPDKEYNGKKFAELCDGQTFAETKTVKVNGHLNNNYSVTSVDVDGKQVHKHAPACIYCGQVTGDYVECTPTAFTADDITAAGHTGTCACGYHFTEATKHTLVGSGRAGDIVVNGYVHNGNIMKCSVCGYETIEENHTMKSTNNGHYCMVCGTEEKAEPHTYTEWTKNSKQQYISECSVCANEITGNWAKVLASVPEWANNGAGYVTVTYESNATCTFGASENVIPKGLKLVFKTGSTCTLNTNVTVKGIVEFESEVTLNENNNNFILDKGVSNASVTLPAGKTMGEKISSQNDFAAAVGNENVGNVVVDGNDIVLTQELAESVQNKDFTISEGATLTVAKNANFASNSGTVTIKNGGKMVVNGKLGNENLTIEGEGTVELANETEAENGTNLTNAFKAGAKNVELTSDAILKSNGETTEMAGNLTIDEGVTFTTESGAHFTDNGKESKLVLNGTWKVEGEIRDLKGCEFGTNSLIELASDTENQNGQSLVVCAGAKVPNVQLDKKANISSYKENLNVAGTLNLTAAGGAESVKVTSSDANKNITVSSAGTLTVDGVDFEFTGSDAGAKSFIVTEGKVDLTDSDITVESGYGIYLKGKSGNLTMNDGSIISKKAPCIGTNQTDTEECTINVKGTTLTNSSEEDDVAVFLPAKGTATFTDCTITGSTAIEAVGLTTLNLKGTTKLKATYKSYQAPNQDSGAQASGNPLLIISRNGYQNGKTMTVNIDKGVTFEKTASSGDIGDIEVNVSTSHGITEVIVNHTGGRTIIQKNTSDNTCKVTDNPNANFEN